MWKIYMYTEKCTTIYSRTATQLCRKGAQTLDQSKRTHTLADSNTRPRRLINKHDDIFECKNGHVLY